MVRCKHLEGEIRISTSALMAGLDMKNVREQA